MKSAKMRKKLRRSLLCLALAATFGFSGCSGAEPASTAGGDLMVGIQPKARATEKIDLKGTGAQAYTDFGLELLKQARADRPEEGVLLSPQSVLSALAMTANGAGNETLAQMEEAFGLPAGELSRYLAAYNSSLPSGEKYSLHQANSLWVREGEVEVERDFLQVNADYFGADVYRKPFDGDTLEEINGWVKEHTHEMIPSILDEIDPELMMVLINALAFEAEWQDPYEEGSVQKRIFTQEDATELTVDMMSSTEQAFLRDENARGFLKYYADKKYAFAALLPDEGVTLGEYLESLTGQRLRQVLTNAQDKEVWARIPKFEMEYESSLNAMLNNMGVTDAFDPNMADFTPMGRCAGGDPLYIGKMIHKAYISVFEQGTRAGAVTAVMIEAGRALPEEPEQVYLERPFLFMIVDAETMLPVFMGTMTGPEAVRS